MSPGKEVVERAPTRRTVLVQSGARDSYQVARALEEAGLLQTLVTDLFWPSDRAWARHAERWLPQPILTMLRQRSAPDLCSDRVTLRAASGLATLLLDKWKGAPKTWRRRMTRYTDHRLGQAAGRIARRTDADLLSYSYYAYDAFQAYGRGALLFQLHPHPASMRRILQRELEDHPDCAASLRQEWELSLPEEDFQHLCAEAAAARGFLVASSFTRQTLVENGIAPEAIQVVPYGVDAARFRPEPRSQEHPQRPLRLLFVGRINQRKGIKYLIEAVKLLGTAQVELTVCGRVVDDLSLFKPIADRVILRPDVGAAELEHAYQAADLFVFPSVAEGFGQVLLEALSSGLPILSTTHTAAPDLIEQGRQGFVVEPRRPDLLAAHMAWALDHRRELAAMRFEARSLAETFTWERFRAGVVASVRGHARQGREAGTPQREVSHAV